MFKLIQQFVFCLLFFCISCSLIIVFAFTKQNISTGLVDNVFQNYTKSSILLIKVGKQNVFYKHFERKILRQCLSCKNFLHTYVIPFGMHHGHVKKLHRDIKT